MTRLTIAETYDRIWPNPWILPLFYILASSLAVVMGITIIYTVIKHFRKDMHIDIQLALFLTVMDTVSGVDFLMAAICNLPPLNIYSSYYNICLVQVITGSTTFIASLVIIGVIALERCLIVVYNIKMKNTYYWLMISICVIIPLFNSILVISTDSIGLMSSGVFCHYDIQTYYGVVAYIIMLTLSAIAISTLVFSYTKIVLFRYHHSQTQQIELGMDPEKVRIETRRTTIKLMSILIINVGTNIPYVIAQIMGLFDNSYFNPKVAFFVIPWCGLNVFGIRVYF
ncbi:hypothetical protein CONCODRAFT_8561 [Conidiobolus coronatus NRRL 28638]|uniref:G-protein coupled receptors family 1 profile domain-containing protein n=1 Tax=Conidiobolus coronatus (strain ATCC 28846 / CBS 209.66 / NRRL 28638) TaxID=796925 RepID=A0A137P1Z2_CONC2|nr:hypothetical protein CONCODRAFT_8561 [Conidiobolus coronatus NRRL 28638]|eukprot:KXN69076.1 hypothetical protein CONCODRAFT_8561 [Conidiobolus coronatus NRRL 28638]